MTPRERGLLLLTQQLGDPDRNPLTPSQYSQLASQVRAAPRRDPDQELAISDLTSMGFDFLTGEHILHLLSQEAQLERYLSRGAAEGCYPIPRSSPLYPRELLENLGEESPPCLWAKGDLSLLSGTMIGLVGSRDILPQNYRFAQEVGRQTALAGLTLISGNARGADLAAQTSCLANGGRVVSVLADSLREKPAVPNLLYLSEDGYDLPFSSQRALQRNRLIHILPRCVYVAQVRPYRSGTWSGTVKNLTNGWSGVMCLDDGSEGARALIAMGASPATTAQLTHLQNLR